MTAVTDHYFNAHELSVGAIMTDYNAGKFDYITLMGMLRNEMCFDDETGLWWMIGIRSGLWHYYQTNILGIEGKDDWLPSTTPNGSRGIDVVMTGFNAVDVERMQSMDMTVQEYMTYCDYGGVDTRSLNLTETTHETTHTVTDESTSGDSADTEGGF